MKILTGETRSRKVIGTLRSLGWGRMATEQTLRPYPFEPWGFDNGAFSCWIHRKPFDAETFKRRLDNALRVASDPILGVAPDIVAGGLRSLEFSLGWMAKLPRDWPWYLAVQDGMETSDVEPHLHLFAGVFLGGTDVFKRQAYRWCQLAHSHRKLFHYARAGTITKLKHAKRVGADSLDSAFPLWSIERLERFASHVEYESTQEDLM